MEEFRCPNCKKPARVGDEFFPFCSRRCKLLDLGSWLDEKYRITRPLHPGEKPPEGESPSAPARSGEGEGDGGEQ